MQTQIRGLAKLHYGLHTKLFELLLQHFSVSFGYDMYNFSRLMNATEFLMVLMTTGHHVIVTVETVEVLQLLSAFHLRTDQQKVNYL